MMGSPEELEYVKCLLCGTDDAELFVRAGGVKAIVQCRRDGLLYLNPRPKADWIREFHSHYVRTDNLEMFDRLRRRALAREAEAIQALKAGGKLLDVGCASGTFFENFPRSNWQFFGVETSPVGAQLARQRYAAEVFVGDILEADLPSNFFDVVTVLDTLFYMPDPRATLAEIRRVLRPDGLLGVEIPGLRYRLLRDRGLLCWLVSRKWRRMSPSSVHLYYFSPRTLRMLLEKCGFRVVEVVLAEASLGHGAILRFMIELHLVLSRALRQVSGGYSIAAKELYLAVKAV